MIRILHLTRSIIVLLLFTVAVCNNQIQCRSDDCNIDCNVYQCNNAIINGTKSNSLSVICNTCINTIILCPDDKEYSCLIYDDNSTIPWTNLTVQVSNDYHYNFLDIDCQSRLCNDLNIKCDNDELHSFKHDTRYIYCTENEEWSCNESSISHCCPENPCKKEQDCIIDCDENIRSCQGYSIDAKLSRSLILTCSGSSNCKGMNINCPFDGECNINCVGHLTCLYLTVNNNDTNYYMNDNSSINIGCYGNQTCKSSLFITKGSTSFNMECIGQGTCVYIDIYAYFVGNILIKCERDGFISDADDSYLSWTDGCCNYADIYVYNGSTFELEAINEDAAKGLTMNIYDTSQVYITGKGGRSLYFAELRANTSSYVEINLASSFNEFDDDFWSYWIGAVSGYSEWYLPMNSTINCYGIACADFGIVLFANNDLSRFNMNVYGCNYCNKISQCITEGFWLYCDYIAPFSTGIDGWSYRDSDCRLPAFEYQTNYDIYLGNDDCGCQEFMENRFKYHPGIDDENCYISPTHQPTIYPTPLLTQECEAGSDCNVECYNTDCNGTLIDGSLSNYLSILCRDAESCKESYIRCPDAGCSISCEKDACHDTRIIYDGVLDDHGRMQINCNNEDACDTLEIRADYIDTLEITSQGDEYCIDWCAEGMVTSNVYARYANKITINAGYHGIRNTRFYVDNATTVGIKGRGQDAFDGNYVYSDNVISLTINCILGIYLYEGESSYSQYLVEWSACQDNDWYLPSTAEINCFGQGCYDMGGLYVQKADLSGIDFKINACSVCEDQNECMNNLEFYCGNSLESQFIYNKTQGCHEKNEYKVENIDNGNGDCGCSDFINNIHFEDRSWDKQCYEPTMEPINISLIIIGCGLLLICAGAAIYYRKRIKIIKLATHKGMQQTKPVIKNHDLSTQTAEVFTEMSARNQ